MTQKLESAESIIDRYATDEIARLTREVEGAQSAILRLLQLVGAAGQCAGCGAAIYWLRHVKTNKCAPYNPDGTSHFSNCPQAARFRRRKEA